MPPLRGYQFYDSATSSINSCWVVIKLISQSGIIDRQTHQRLFKDDLQPRRGVMIIENDYRVRD